MSPNTSTTLSMATSSLNGHLGVGSFDFVVSIPTCRYYSDPAARGWRFAGWDLSKYEAMMFLGSET